MSNKSNVGKVSSIVDKAESIEYHTRLESIGGIRFSEERFNGETDEDIINRLVKKHFTIEYTSFGKASFVDKFGRKVCLYIAVDPETTEVGKLAWQAEQTKRLEMERIEEAKEKEET